MNKYDIGTSLILLSFTTNKGHRLSYVPILSIDKVIDISVTVCFFKNNHRNTVTYVDNDGNEFINKSNRVSYGKSIDKGIFISNGLEFIEYNHFFSILKKNIHRFGRPLINSPNVDGNLVVLKKLERFSERILEKVASFR